MSKPHTKFVVIQTTVSETEHKKETVKGVFSSLRRANAGIKFLQVNRNPDQPDYNILKYTEDTIISDSTEDQGGKT